MQSIRPTSCAIALGVALSGLFAPIALANTQDIGQAELEQSMRQTSLVSSKLTTLQRAVSAFYSDKLRFPSSLDDLDGTSGLPEIYYKGNYKTPIGTISGVATANSYTLIIPVSSNPTNHQLGIYESVAGEIGGDYNSASNTIRVSVPIPHAASVRKNMLQTTPDTSGFGLNTMETDLSLGDNDITNVSKLLGESATFTNATSNEVQALSGSMDNLTTKDLLVNIESSVTDGDADTILFNTLDVTQTLTSKDFEFNSIDFTSVSADNTVAQSLDVAAAATVGTLIANEVEFERGNFHASLSADIVKVYDKFATDSLKVDRFISPVSFNSPVLINDVMTTMSSLTINGQLIQNSGITQLGKTTVLGDLETSTAQFVNNLTINNSVLANTAQFGGDVGVTGRTDLEAVVGTSANIGNLLRVNGSANVSNQVSLNGDLYAGSRLVARNGEWYENGQKLSSRYYGKNDKVANADKLGGKDSSLLAVKSRNNVFKGATTFSRNLVVNGTIRSGSGVLVDSSGRLYDQGVLVSSKYASKSDLSRADSDMQNYMNQIETAVVSEMNRKRSELQGYASRINKVRSGQGGIDTKNNQSQSYLNTASTNLSTALNYTNSGTQSLDGVKGKVSNLERLGNTVQNMTAYNTTVTRKTHTIYKESQGGTGGGGGTGHKWVVSGSTCSTQQASGTAGGSCSSPGAKAYGKVVGMSCNLSGNPANPSWGPSFEQLVCR
ncbi:TPA: hypothetical protein KD856_004039 [Vibrio parahaemolyticus]|nr:hypothetical protein [Vibrio parahaemolyticus]